jgi:lysophospholipase L1-like esterase
MSFKEKTRICTERSKIIQRPAIIEMKVVYWFVFLIFCRFLLALGETHLRAFRYLALGDSYTIGESVSEDERWPNQLSTALKVDGIQMDVTIVARTGWTTAELWQGIQDREIEPPYDLVSLLIGVNNQYRGYDVDEYRAQIRFLLNKAIEYAGDDEKRVVVLSIPDWGVTPFAADRDRRQIAREIDSFNAVNQEESKNSRVYYVDVTPLSRQAEKNPALIAADGLHPSGKMYALWAEKTLPIIKEILIGST